MTDFHDVSFPLTLAFGARGGPQRRTDVTQLASGGEYRNSPHANSRRQFDVGSALKTIPDIQTLTTFFEARHGQHYAFRFRDPLDNSSGLSSSTFSADDQQIGVGDGIKTKFQLTKTYADSAGNYVRPITKPITGTVLIAVDGVPTTIDIDALTGVITFDIAPGHGALITAGFQFDVPVRFDTDHLDISLEAFNAGKVATIPLIEVTDHA